jgi:hypothetical protein
MCKDQYHIGGKTMAIAFGGRSQSRECILRTERLYGNKRVQLLHFSVVLCTVRVFKTGGSITYIALQIPDAPYECHPVREKQQRPCVFLDQ